MVSLCMVYGSKYEVFDNPRKELTVKYVLGKFG